MFRPGAFIADLRSWEQWLLDYNVSPQDINRPAEFPFVAFMDDVGKDCPTIFTLDPAMAQRLVGKPISVNSFEDGLIKGVGIRNHPHDDERGWLVEMARTDEHGAIAMGYISNTIPGVTRGPHEHRMQTDRFCLMGNWTLWLWDNRPSSPTYLTRRRISGNHVASGPSTITVPPGVVHAYRNNGPSSALLVINLPDRLYKGQNSLEHPDEIRHEEDDNTLFQPW